MFDIEGNRDVFCVELFQEAVLRIAGGGDHREQRRQRRTRSADVILLTYGVSCPAATFRMNGRLVYAYIDTYMRS